MILIGRPVIRSLLDSEGRSTGKYYSGVVTEWLPASESDFTNVDSGVPAALWKIKHTSGDLKGDKADLELYEFLDSKPIPKPLQPAKKKPSAPVRVRTTRTTDDNVASLVTTTATSLEVQRRRIKTFLKLLEQEEITRVNAAFLEDKLAMILVEYGKESTIRRAENSPLWPTTRPSKNPPRKCATTPPPPNHQVQRRRFVLWESDADTAARIWLLNNPETFPGIPDVLAIIRMIKVEDFQQARRSRNDNDNVLAFGVARGNITVATLSFPALCTFLCRWAVATLPRFFKFTTLQLAKNLKKQLHVDQNNLWRTSSAIISLGDHLGGNLWTKRDGELQCRDSWCIFNGHEEHYTRPFWGLSPHEFDPERFSFVAFSQGANNLEGEMEGYGFPI